MRPQEIVRARYPQAEAHYHQADVDADLPHDRYAHWSVYVGPRKGARMLGVSMSEDGAWLDAATTVQAETN